MRDGLAMRYGLEGVDLRERCVCKNRPPFSIRHAMACNSGGVLLTRHNELRDLVGSLADILGLPVVRDPIVRARSTEADLPGCESQGLNGDLRIEGLFHAGGVVSIDFRVHDTDAISSAQDTLSALSNQEGEKINKYDLACKQKGWRFVPFVATAAEGIYGQAAAVVINRMADLLAEKWQKSPSSVRSWLHTRMAFSIIRGTSLCIRDKRYRWSKIGLFHYQWQHSRGVF
jgi:hypothetical protein